MRPFIAAVTLGFTLALAACDRPPHPAKNDAAQTTPAPKAKPGTAEGSKSAAKLSAEQKKFLTIITVGEAKDDETLSLPGRVSFRPQAQSAIGAPVAGRVVAQLARAGEIVKAGTPLLVIESADAASMRAAADQAAIRLTAAEQSFRRHTEMVAKGVGLESELQEADARLKDARAENNRARYALSMIGGGNGARVTVNAPTAGVVLVIKAAVGATVVPGGDPLLELGDPSQLQIIAQVTESDLRRIAVGQQADIEIPALSTQGKAIVDSISPRVDAESRRAPVYLNPLKRIDNMQPGMLAQIVLHVRRESSVSVPAAAVLIRNGKERIVYVENFDGTFEARPVKTGTTSDGNVVILEGIRTGERIVTQGALLLDTQAELLL